jgi:beta-galactosidase
MKDGKRSSATKLHFGAAYYPEHWPEARWTEDLRLMTEAGMTVVRMAEFAWSSLEPEEGRFDLEWLERAIAQAAGCGIVSVLGTPTAAPPAWLAQKYPATLAIDESGRRVQFGNRCHYCVNSTDYHRAVDRIVNALAERFGADPHVIGWQIDNEYNRICYCDVCRRAFQDYLQRVYGSLASLNRHWSTAYWSQTYSAWEQIPIPIGHHNPGLRLAFQRFVTESYRRFQSRQIDALRRHVPASIWITHNFMNWFDAFDHYEISRDLDMASWDWYVGTGYPDYLASGASHDLARGYKRRNFWLMETQPGCVNWSPLNNPVRRGEARVMAFHALAHGADALLYWQWRSALGGQEQYHGTLIDQAGRPRPFYDEAQRVGTEFAKISSLVAGTEVVAEAALINDFDSRWSIQWQRHHKDFDYVDHFNRYYVPLARRNINTDILGAKTIASARDLAGYKLVIAPALVMIPDNAAQALLEYVRAGGVLVLTVRTGLKDVHNALLPVRQPGPLTEAAGVEVEDYYTLAGDVLVWDGTLQAHARLWAERLRPLGDGAARVIASYVDEGGWLDEAPAVTESRYGKGTVYYVGACLDEAAQDALLGRIIGTAALETMAALAGVEIRARQAPDGKKVWFIINHTPEKRTLSLAGRWHDQLSGRDLAADHELPPFGVAVCVRA